MGVPLCASSMASGTSRELQTGGTGALFLTYMVSMLGCAT